MMVSGPAPAPASAAVPALPAGAPCGANCGRSRQSRSSRFGSRARPWSWPNRGAVTSSSLYGGRCRVLRRALHARVVVVVGRAARLLRRLPHHHLGAGQVLVVHLHQPAAVAGVHRGRILRRVAAGDDVLVQLLDVVRLEAVVVHHAELLRRELLGPHHVLEPVVAVRHHHRDPLEGVVARAALPLQAEAEDVLVEGVGLGHVLHLHADVQDVVGDAGRREVLAGVLLVHRALHVLDELDGVAVRIHDHEAAVAVGVGIDFRRHLDALAREVVAQPARVRGLEPDADQAILVALQRRRDLDELRVVDLEGDQLAFDGRVLGGEGLGEADDPAVELPRLVEALDLGGEAGDPGDLRTLGLGGRAPDGHGQQEAQRQGELAVGLGHSCGLRLCDLARLRRAPPDRNNCKLLGACSEHAPGTDRVLGSRTRC